MVFDDFSFLSRANTLPKGETRQILYISINPLQQGKYFTEYCNCVIYYYIMLELIEDFYKNFDEMKPQDLLLITLDHSW